MHDQSTTITADRNGQQTPRPLLPRDPLRREIVDFALRWHDGGRDPSWDPPAPEVLAVRRKHGMRGEKRTEEDFLAAGRRMIARAEAMPAEPDPIPHIGPAVPVGCPIIPTPEPVTEDVFFRGRWYSAETLNRSSLEHRNELQDRLIREFEQRQTKQLSRAEEEPVQEPKTMQDRIVEAVAGAADPLSGSAIARLVGANKAGVFRALDEMAAEGRADRQRINAKMVLWSVPAAGTSGSGSALGGSSTPPAGVVGNQSLAGPEPHAAGSRNAYPGVVEVVGTTRGERARSIIEHLMAGRMSDFDFAVLALRVRNPDFVLAWRLMREDAA